jgi:[lysine-biosynthesis-protein LysW]--L-2-aminoadipate ligase
MSLDARLAVLVTDLRGEERRIFAVLERRGIPYVQVDERVHHLGSAKVSRYRAVLNRTRNPYAAALFEGTGHRVFNSSAVVMTCSDPVLTSVALVRAGVPTPETMVTLSDDAAVVEQEVVEGRGIRVIVVGGEVVGAGPPLRGEVEWLAQHAAEAVGGGVLAVDIVERSSGALLVTKVDQAMEFLGVAEASGVDIAELIVEHVDRNSPPIEWVRERAA